MAEDQHHQSPAASCPGSRAAEQAPAEEVLCRDVQWGEGGTIRSFDPERESAAHFQRFDRQLLDYFDCGVKWTKHLKMSVPTLDANKKDAFFCYHTQFKMYVCVVDGMALRK